MMEKIIVAIDSFKGCLNSHEVAEVVGTAIKGVYPACDVIGLTVADGGEGTVEALVGATNGHIRSVMVHDPLMHRIPATYGILGDGDTAVIGMSAASGLPLVPENRRNPMLTTTRGTGELIADALENGCSRIILGIGGSATNDAGTGMLQALGYRFLDKDGQELQQGGQILEHIERIDLSHRNPLLDNVEFRVACDVDNIFCGPNGAAYIYAPQKGADEQMVKDLDRGLKHFAGLIRVQMNRDIENMPGAGAAGGLGGGATAFLNAKLQPGIQLVLEITGFEEMLDGAGLVITGEGKMDSQTAMGKAPQGIASAAASRGIPVIALTGDVENAEVINHAGISAVFSITPRPLSLQEAMDPDTARKNIRQLVSQLFRFSKIFNPEISGQ